MTLCAYCASPISGPITEDHILPRWRGGKDDPDNIRLCCRRCNHLLEMAGECVGTLACARVVAAGKRRVRNVLQDWRLMHGVNQHGNK
jgi:hypothetical protein